MEQQNGSVFDKSDSSVSEELSGIEEESLKSENKLEGKPFSENFQSRKESWYDKVPLTVKQLDVIVYVGIAALVVVFILIALEAAGIYKIG